MNELSISTKKYFVNEQLTDVEIMIKVTRVNEKKKVKLKTTRFLCG